MKLETVVTGGTVVFPDAEPTKVDIGIANGRVAALLEPGAAVDPATDRIDATGRHVFPGLIDAHSVVGLSGAMNCPTADQDQDEISDLNKVIIFNNVGNIYQATGEYSTARSYFEKALALAPDFEDARHNLKMIKSHDKGFLILLRAILK